jgi:5-methylcytosine-specific restriction endonuclease McrA
VTWVRYDDNADQHPKWLELRGDGTNRALERGRRARCLHQSMMLWSGRMNSDGVIPITALPLVSTNALLTMPEALDAAQLLVDVKLLRRRTKRLGGGFEIHDFLDYQPSKETVQRKVQADDHRALMRDLHNWLHKSPIGKRVKAKVLERDGTTCCYCGRDDLRTDGDRKSPDRRTFDLIDPATAGSWDRSGAALDATEVLRVHNLWCVACGYCNSLKNNRSPDETDGMSVLPGHGPNKHIPDLPRSAAIQSGADRESGTDRDGIGSGLDGQDLEADPHPSENDQEGTSEDGR